MSAHGFNVTFWGVRGSIPTPGATTAAVGGNTSCVEVSVGGHRVILDGGTGLRQLGDSLRGQSDLTAHIFFSHLHWDHIQGVPFFGPAFEKGHTFHLHAGRRDGRTLESALIGQMSFPYFPVRFSKIESTLTFHDLSVREAVHLDGGVSVYGVEGFHPDGVFAWRIEHRGHVLVYATDTEPSPESDARIATLAQGADVLIHDAQYTPEQYDEHRGWGHSTMMDGARIAQAAKVGTYVLFHHDPAESDEAVAAKTARAAGVFERSVAAREGLVIDVTRGRTDPLDAG